MIKKLSVTDCSHINTVKKTIKAKNIIADRKWIHVSGKRHMSNIIYTLSNKQAGIYCTYTNSQQGPSLETSK